MLCHLTFACNPEDAFPNMYPNGAHVSWSPNYIPKFIMSGNMMP